jgi:hypothetical protein
MAFARTAALPRAFRQQKKVVVIGEIDAFEGIAA